ncbi:MAG: ABC transporter ATP-binding protein [Myxococcales bacterium]|nr:MAG: ABC transporter ATP-binding protein [Myxococcales bacterium]
MTSDAPILVAQALSRTYGPRVVLGNVSLSVHDEERVGLVGLNGSGKSTLARVLAGREPPDTGTVARRRDASIQYLDQSPEFPGDPTAREAVSEGLGEWYVAHKLYEATSEALGRGDGDFDKLLAQQEKSASDIERLGGWERGHQVDALLGHLGIRRPDDSVATMSGGERRRVALARLLIARPALAILDEPTNHLDVETIDWLEEYLIDDYEGALLLITHDRYMLDRVAKRTLELDQGEVRSYDGGYERYLEAKAERQMHEARTEANRQNFLRKEIEWLRRQPKARTTKQKARIDRAETAILAPKPQAERMAVLAMEEARSGKTILELRGVALEAGGRRLVSNLNLTLTAGERVGIVGRNGTGKTTLLKVLTGQLPPAAGQVVIGQNTKVAYFDQERSGLDDDKSIYDNIVGDQPRIEINGHVFEPHSYIERFLFEPQRQRQKVGALSGGERARVALARMLRQSANLILLDEPTNDLDVATLNSLEEMLVEFGGTALVVTHDRWFLDRVATAILAIDGEGNAIRYAGNHASYREQRAYAEAQKQQQQRQQQQQGASSKKARPVAQQRSVRLSHSEELELAGIVARIEEADRRITSLEARLADPTAYGAGGDVRPLLADLEKARAESARLMDRWTELEAIREAATR